MRALAHVAALVGLSLALTGCMFVRDFEEFRPEGYDRVGLCQNVGTWPAEPRGSDGADGDPLLFAFANSSFGLTEYDWTATSYNIDGYCTYESAQGARCVPNALHLDGPFGLDNVFGQHVVPRLRTAGSELGGALRNEQEAGRGMLLVGVSGYDGSGDDRAVRVELRLSASPDAVPLISTTNAYVADGRLVADLGSVPLPLPGIGSDGNLARAHLIADFDGGVMPRATLLGRWRIEDAASSLGACLGMDAATAATFFEDLADVPAEGTGNPPCDAISVAVAFEGRETRSHSPTTVPVPSICD